MSNIEQIEQHKQDTREIIAALIEDGSDPDALYEIEHHFSAEDLDAAEPAMTAAFNRGYQVFEAETVQMEDGTPFVCFDIVVESPLSAERIDEQLENLIRFADEFDIVYDGWGTYFESDDEEDYDEQDFDDDED